MYISAIDSLPLHRGHGTEFDDLDQVADAIRCLGGMTDQNAADVEQLIVRMRSDIDNRVTHSELARGLMRNQPVPMRLTPSGLAVAKGGLVRGGQFFAHNELGLTNRPPFRNMEVRVGVTNPNDDGVARCLLKVTDHQGPWNPGLKKADNHTDSLLAHKITGVERPIQHITVVADYEPAGLTVEFDFATLLKALGDVEGLGRIDSDPAAIAQGYYQQQLTPFGGDGSHRLVLEHSSGASIMFNGCFGIQRSQDDDAVHGHDTQIVLNGTVMSGPKNKSYAAPHAWFTIHAGKQTTNDQLYKLQMALESALWSNNC